MKYIVVLVLAVLVVFFSCNTSTKTVQRPTNSLLRPDQMPVEEFTVNTDRDTVLQTKGGALLKIPAGALEAKGSTTAVLQVKEAYTLSQMIQAGLTTQTGDDMLASDGMIMIDAKPGQDVNIKKGITVATPTDSYKDDMQLFKGTENADGSIDWKDPAPLQSKKDTSRYARGRQIFQAKCAGCHGIGSASPKGPDLAHFPKRIPFGEGSSVIWAHAFRSSYASPAAADTTKAVEQVEGNPIVQDRVNYDSDSWHHWQDNPYLYICNLSKMFGGPVDLSQQAPFTVKNEISESWLVYDYIQKESDLNNLPYPAHAYLYNSTDSCRIYRDTKRRLEDEQEIVKEERKTKVETSGPMVNIIKHPASDEIGPPPPPPPIDFEDKVKQELFGASYYQFTIETFGWYNIDVLVKGRNGVEESELFVRITGEYKTKLQVYLIIPSVKVHVQGGPAERNEEEIAFLYKSGKINLPQKTRAFILAVTEENGSMAYALKEFTTSLQQEIEISLSKTTKEEFDRVVKLVGGDGIIIKVDDAPNTKEIRAADERLKAIEKELKDVESWQPKGCDCNCTLSDGRLVNK